MSQHLKTSLSGTLTRFYPSAGKIKDHVSIECNDNGAHFVEARCHCHLFEILLKPDAEMLRKFLPVEIESITGPLLLVQVTSFACGGMAIGICIFHILTDASTISLFIKSWATTACLDDNSSEPIAVPEYSAVLFFPPKDFPIYLAWCFSTKPIAQQGGIENLSKHLSIVCDASDFVNCYISFNRFVFDARKIAVLKAKAASESMPQPAQVEVVTALLWKSAMTASRFMISLRGHPCKLSLLTHVVNLRKRPHLPLPELLMGNPFCFLAADTDGESTDELELKDLVCKLRKGFDELMEKEMKKANMGEEMNHIINRLARLVKRDDVEVYMCTSWHKFGVHKADFGWAKLGCVSSMGRWLLNAVVLMDTKQGDGIEAWVTLDEQHMAMVKHDQQLLEFASLNPLVLPTNRKVSSL